MPSALVALSVNVITQGLCVRGVNRLTSVSSVLFSFFFAQFFEAALNTWYVRHHEELRLNNSVSTLLPSIWS